MSIISRERALCMLHCAPFTKENVKKYAQVIERSENLEICYMENPMEPMITSNFKINGCPFRFHRYPSETVLVPTNETKKTESEEAVKAVIRPTTATKPNTVKKDAAKKRAEEKNTTIPENIEKGTTGKVDRALLLINHAQVAEFLNVVYLTQYPRNPELYDFKKVKSEEILDLVRFYTYLFDKKSVKGLVRWFARASVNIYNAELCRDNVLYSTEKRLSYSRELYVMKKEFIIYALKEVVATIPTYPKLVNNFKEEDCCIVGYLKLPKRFYNTELFLKALEL
ncbi:hypothetical protein BY458DRAFT_497414 [Sporodiniella umbellata]|nr:hypothetical protein BY458DRAFT_497414 [Sporodiniella umbellata]